MSTATQEASAGPVAGSSASPYELRRKEFQDARKAAGNDAQLFLNDETELLQELELADDELDEKEHNAALQRMTNAQVQKHIHAMIVPRAALELQEKYYQDIIYADPRNERGNPMLMFNTYSSFFMTQVVSKQFRTVATELQSASPMPPARKFLAAPRKHWSLPWQLSWRPTIRTTGELILKSLIRSSSWQTIGQDGEDIAFLYRC